MASDLPALRQTATFEVPRAAILEVARVALEKGESSLPDVRCRAAFDLAKIFRSFPDPAGFLAVERGDSVQIGLPEGGTDLREWIAGLWTATFAAVKTDRPRSELLRKHVGARARGIRMVRQEVRTDGEIATGLFWNRLVPPLREAVGDREVEAFLAGFYPLTEVLQYADQIGWRAPPPVSDPGALLAYLATLDAHLPAIARRKFDSEADQRNWVWEKRSVVNGLRETFEPPAASAAGPEAPDLLNEPRTDLLEGGDWGVDFRGVPVKLQLRRMDSHISFEAPTRGGKTHAAMALADEAIRDEGLPVIAVGHDRRWSRMLPNYDSAVFCNEIDMEAAMDKPFTFVYVDDFKNIDRRVILPMLGWLTSQPECDAKKLVVVFEEASRYNTEGLMRFFSESLKFGAVAVLVVQRSERMIRPTTRGQCGVNFVGRLTRDYFDDFVKVYGQDFARGLVGVGKQRMRRHDFLAFGIEIESPFVFRVTRPFRLGPEMSGSEIRALARAPQPPSPQADPGPEEAPLETYARIIREEFGGRLPSINALVKKAREWRDARGEAVEASWPYVQRAVDRLKDAGELVEAEDGGYVLKEVAGGSH